MRVLAIGLVLFVAAMLILPRLGQDREPLFIDATGSEPAPEAGPSVWPKNAALAEPDAMMCRPMIITVGPGRPKPIVRT